MTVEEVIAETLFRYVDPPGRSLWGRERTDHQAQAILSALKAAGLVIVPEEPTREIVDIAFPPAPKWRSTSLSTQVRDYAVKTYMEDYRAMIRAATSPGAPETVLESPHE